MSVSPELPAGEGAAVSPAATQPIEQHSPEDYARMWLRDIHYNDLEPGTREADEEILRLQLVSVYGLATPGEGEPSARDERKIAHRLGLLSVLAQEDPDPVEERRAEEFAYDFVHLVWKEAEAEDKQFTARRREEELHAMATHDALTGLKNRRGLYEDLDFMIGQALLGEYDDLALLYVDIDKFKEINDTPGLGHRRGDEILQGVARVLQHNTRKPSRGGNPDIVARPRRQGEAERSDDSSAPEAENIRMGGDEFVVLVPLTRHQSSAHPSRGTRYESREPHENLAEIASRIHARLTDYLQRETEGLIPDIGASVGYVLWDPSMDAEELIRLGDEHMYEIKRQRRLANGQTNGEK